MEKTNRSQDETDQILNLLGGDKRIIPLSSGSKQETGPRIIGSDQEILELTQEHVIAALEREKTRIR